MRSSDVIAEFICGLLNEAGGICELQRNELANKFKVVPSQISYVIASRFTPEQGFMVESRRGGGGYIRIKRVKIEQKDVIMHIINSVGPNLDANTAKIYTKNMYEGEVIDENQAKFILAAINDNVYYGLTPRAKNAVRAAIFKNMLITIIS